MPFWIPGDKRDLKIDRDQYQVLNIEDRTFHVQETLDKLQHVRGIIYFGLEVTTEKITVWKGIFGS